MGMGKVMMTSMVDNGDYDGEAWWHVLHWSRHWQRGSRYLNHSICWSPYHTIVSAGHHTITFYLLVTTSAMLVTRLLFSGEYCIMQTVVHYIWSVSWCTAISVQFIDIRQSTEYGLVHYIWSVGRWVVGGLTT